MAQSLDSIVDDAEFEKNYKRQVSPRSQQDIFFIWLVLVMISVIGAHFLVGLSGAGGITGYVVSSGGSESNFMLLLASMFVTFIMVLIVGLVHHGVTQKDK